MIFLRKHYKLVSALLFPCLILFIPVTSIPLDGLTTVEYRLIAIFALAALCWILEPIPVYATSLLVILLELVLVSDGGLLAFRAETGHAGFGSLFQYQELMATFASPIILLFLGGFFLALEAIDARGGHIVLLICDHVMPGKTGIDFLSVVADDIRYGNTRKLVLTGLATHQDTIKAINRADVDYYVEKPWDRVRLVEVVRAEVTEYILRAGISYQPYIEVLDQEIIYAYLRTRT